VIGRFLEHSRIFHFAAGEDDPLEGDFFIGSADWMHRNLSARVEVVTPVAARAGRDMLWEILTLLLADERQAWVLDAQGEYTQLNSASTDGPHLGTHQTLMNLTRQRHEAATKTSRE
jgi:polyphosphate kinase